MSTEAPAGPPDTSTESVLRRADHMRKAALHVRHESSGLAFPERLVPAANMVEQDAAIMETLVNERDALRRGSHDKRDMFALHAMSSLLIRGADVESDGPLLTVKQRRQALADSAYAIADAMCERRISR